ncbi:MAG: SPOR domain-containing protein [Bryobacteraceae bacterium]
MARTEDGEFELVLGNVQLISVFLIVVILLGVFFSMGYIVGRNSVPAAVSATSQQPAKPIVVEPPSHKDTEPLASTTPPASTESATPAAESKPAPVESPFEKSEASKPSPAPVPLLPEKKPAAQEKKPEPERKPEPPSARAATASVDRPAPGRYWQVVSTSRPEAEIIAGALAKKGLTAVVAPSSKEGFYRVLVGPVGDASDAAKTRSQLEGAGFKSPILQKY